jgi:hypothetical protein
LKEFDKILCIEGLKNVPIAILGNKIDKRDACSEEDIRTLF